MENSSNRSQLQLRLSRSVPIIKKLYHKTDAKHISQCFRKEKSLTGEDDKSLTYGEVDAASFMQILALTKGATTGLRKFVDLGCGAGMPCICAAMSPYGFSSVLGIEIVEGLVDLAKALHSRLVSELSSTTSSSSQQPAVKGHTIKQSSNCQKQAVIKKNGEEVDLIPLIHTVFEKHSVTEVGCIAMDLLATQVCKLCGHKSYKASLKKHKSFLRLIESHPEQFKLSENGKEVQSLKTINAVPEEPPGVEADNVSLNEQEVKEDNCDTANQEMNNQDNDGGFVEFSITESDKKLFNPLVPIEYIHGSIFEYDWWTDSDVAYTASLLFSDEMMQTLVSLVLKMKPNSWIISLRPLPLTEEEALRVKLVNDSFFKMSWQMARVYTYQVQEES